MSLKLKTILFSSLAIAVLIVSFYIFQEYKTTSNRLYQTINTLDLVNHASHEIAIEILLDLRDVDSLNKHLDQIPVITHQLKTISPNIKRSSELVAMELSFVRVKRIVEILTQGQPIQRPLLEQIQNEMLKINRKVAKLKLLSEREIDRLQTRSEIIITILYYLLVLYIFGMFILLFFNVTKPILQISKQIEQVGHGELDQVSISERKDEIGQLADAFNTMNSMRKQTEKALKEEIQEHMKTLEEVKVLSGFLPICASCKSIRDDKGYWNKIESYIQSHSQAQFSHGICPECVEKLYPEYSGDISKLNESLTEEEENNSNNTT